MNIESNTSNFIVKMLLKISYAVIIVLTPGYDILTIVTDELLSSEDKILTHWGYRIGQSLFDVVACCMVSARPSSHSL